MNGIGLLVYALIGAVVGVWHITHHPVLMMSWKPKAAHFIGSAIFWPLIILHWSL